MQAAWLEPLTIIARDAGAAILSFYGKDDTVTWTKKDDSPLTQADLAAHEVIVAGLALLTPDIPVLSEESTDICWQQRQQWGTYWLVDPLDGTKEFIKRNGEFTVNIALISDNQPVMAVVYAPVLEKLYFASISQGCFVQFRQQPPIRLDIRRSGLSSPLKIVGSRSHPGPDVEKFNQQFQSFTMVPTGSSLKFCLVAEGKADIYPRLGPTMEWDTGAGQCIAQCAGAIVSQLDGDELSYNNKESLLNPYFVVANPSLDWSSQ